MVGYLVLGGGTSGKRVYFGTKRHHSMAGLKVLGGGWGWRGMGEAGSGGKQSLITSGTHEFLLEPLSRSVPPSASH